MKNRFKKKKMYCPYDAELLDYKGEKEIRSDNYGRTITSEYQCSFCKRRFVSDDSRADLSTYGNSYVNLRSGNAILVNFRNDLKPVYQAYGKKDLSKREWRSCLKKREICSECKISLTDIVIKFSESEQYNEKFCSSCGSFYTSDEISVKLIDYLKLLGKRRKCYREELKKKELKEKEEKELKKKKFKEIAIKKIEKVDVVVKCNIFSCAKKQHDIEDITAEVQMIDWNGNPTTMIVHAGYCYDCERYFIFTKDYRGILKKGIPLCKIISQEHLDEDDTTFFDSFTELKEESDLKLYGYNVQSKKNLSDALRYKILTILIDEGIKTQSEILNHLDWLIRYNGNNVKFRSAVEKWKYDRIRISKYNRDIKTTVGVASISE